MNKANNVNIPNNLISLTQSKAPMPAAVVCANHKSAMESTKQAVEYRLIKPILIGNKKLICEEANKPFWLQMVGTGITTTWAAHLGAVCVQAKWPAITCMNIWESELITEKIELRGGFHRVPETPGIGVEVDQTAMKKYSVDYTFVEPPRHVYRYSRLNSEVTYYGCSKQELHSVYPEYAMPIFETGSTLEVVSDDGSKTFKELYGAVQDGSTLRRVE